MIKVDLGCGFYKQDGFIGLDIVKDKSVDVTVDIDKEGIPFDDDSVEYLYTGNFLEHILNFNYIMDEIYRVCKDGAVVEILVPHFKSIPFEEHIREFRSSSFINYEISNSIPGYNKFLICVSRKLVFTNKFMNYLFGSHPYFFECFYPFRINCQMKMFFKVVKK